MGRQSARIYYQGKDHKEIYFNGHYHDQMYIAGSDGKAVLVWEKVKGVPPEHIHLIESIGDRYYALGSDNFRYINWNYWYSSDSPYRLSSVQPNAYKNVELWVIIKEEDGIALLPSSIQLATALVSNYDINGIRYDMLMPFIPITGSRLDFAGMRNQGVKGLYEYGYIVIGNGRTCYGYYFEAGNNSKYGFQILREDGSQESIITTFDGSRLYFDKKTYARGGRIFHTGAYSNKHSSSGYPFMLLNENETAAEIIEISFSAEQERYIKKEAERQYRFKYSAWAEINVTDAELFVNGALYIRIDYGENISYTIGGVSVKLSGTHRYSDGGELDSFREDIKPSIKVVFDFQSLRVASVRSLFGGVMYNEDKNLMKYDNYKVWFRLKQNISGGGPYDGYYFVWTNGETQHEISIKDDYDLRTETYEPISCFFLYEGYLYFGLNNFDYFIRVDMSSDTYEKVEKDAFLS